MRKTTLFIATLILLGCGQTKLNTQKPTSPSKNSEQTEDKTTAKETAESCDAKKTNLYAWMDSHSPCVSDSDCRTDYGGCLSIYYSVRTNLTELQSLIDSFNNACTTSGGLCGIPPGIPACASGVCTRH